jgi:alkylhydroperoxidase/carboxymuconolactone decarboxylase family protein YurZ
MPYHVTLAGKAVWKPEDEKEDMATIRLISEAEATGKVKDIFEDFKRTRGVDFVPNYWRAMAAFPDYLEATWNKYKAVMLGGKLDLRTKEIIALAVSATNGCDY